MQIKKLHIINIIGMLPHGQPKREEKKRRRQRPFDD